MDDVIAAKKKTKPKLTGTARRTCPRRRGRRRGNRSRRPFLAKLWAKREGRENARAEEKEQSSFLPKKSVLLFDRLLSLPRFTSLFNLSNG